MSDHTAKRQRLTGSFSPASPPYHLDAKTNEQTKPVVHPSTPTSPPYMSANPSSNGGFATNATGPAPEMTPPSSVNMSQQLSQPATSASNQLPFPTPGSTTGVAFSSNLDSDGDATMADSVDDDAEKLGEHRRSNHNRQSPGLPAGKGAVYGDNGATGSSLFKLCQSTHPVSRPHGSQNLFELYGLSDLAKSVARIDPVTGEKINKLRKSYEGHIKALQIAGKAKALKMEGVLTKPLSLPENDFYNQRVAGKDLKMAITEQGGLDANLDALMNSAFAGMAPGPLPSDQTTKYRAYLGTDETLKVKGADGPANRSVQPTPTASSPMNPAIGPRATRPERQGSKRSYTDISFQGYGEGFTDDGYADSTGGEDDGHGTAKKRRIGAFERASHSVEVGGVRQR